MNCFVKYFKVKYFIVHLYSATARLCGQASATELAETVATVAPAADPQSQPPADEPCDLTLPDSQEDSVCRPTPGRTDSNVSDVERQWQVRYPNIERVQLAELREAFLLLATANAPSMSPRSAAAVADTARLDVADIATCLRAIGQNPTQVTLLTTGCMNYVA